MNTSFPSKNKLLITGVFCIILSVIVWNTPATELTLREKAILKSKSKVCNKQKLKANTKELCKKWGMT